MPWSIGSLRENRDSAHIIGVMSLRPPISCTFGVKSDSASSATNSLIDDQCTSVPQFCWRSNQLVPKVMASDIGSASHFWSHLFENDQLILQLRSLSVRGDCTSSQLSDYGRVKLTVRRATADGDAYMSDSYCVKAQLESGGEFGAFVKVMPENPYTRASVESQSLFDREMAIYRELHASLCKLRAGADVPLRAPVLYYARNSSREPVIVVMEDLKSQGFRMVDKAIGCTFEEASLTLEALAHFHALSIALMRQWKTNGVYSLPESLQFISKKTLIESTDPESLSRMLSLDAEVFRRMGHPEAADWFLREARDIDQVLCLEDPLQCEPLACILHADCWINNLMFRSENGRSVDMRLVDWQITKLGHPVTDCLYFLFTSTAPEMRALHFQSLMDDYFRTLAGSLAKLGIPLDGYTLKEFRLDVRKRLRWGLLVGLMVMPAILDKSIMEQLNNCHADEQPSYQDGEAYNVFGEVMDQIKDVFNADKMMTNQLLCHRMLQLLLEVKAALQQPQ